MPYALEFEARALRDLSRLDPQIERQVRVKLNELAETATTARHHALTGPRYSDQFRLRAGDYRARYRLDHVNRRITVLRVQHRREACR